METNIDLTKILHAGQTIYSPVFGYGTVMSTSSMSEGEEYPIYVKFSKGTFANIEYGVFREWFTKEGKYIQRASEDAECVLFPSKEERDWSKYMPKKSKNNLKPFERVLCRNKNTEQWVVGIFSHYLNADFMVATVGGNYYHCIPYEGNEHLVGTTYMP